MELGSARERGTGLMNCCAIELSCTCRRDAPSPIWALWMTSELIRGSTRGSCWISSHNQGRRFAYLAGGKLRRHCKRKQREGSVQCSHLRSGAVPQSSDLTTASQDGESSEEPAVWGMSRNCVSPFAGCTRQAFAIHNRHLISQETASQMRGLHHTGVQYAVFAVYMPYGYLAKGSLEKFDRCVSPSVPAYCVFVAQPWGRLLALAHWPVAWRVPCGCC